MSNVLSEEKKQQVIALGKLGWPLRQIEQATSTDDLQTIVYANRGTEVGRAAKAELARVMLNQGLNDLPTEQKRSKAIGDVERVETEDADDQAILGEFQKGYNFKGKLLRPAMVKVAVRS